ncbi:MAG: hypothetical protein WCG12_15680 [Alcaligenaceae bacterium]
MAQMFRITLLTALALMTALGLLPNDTWAQSGLRFNPGGLAPGMPYSTSSSILDSMPAPASEPTTQPEPAAAKSEPEPAAARGAATATPVGDSTEATIHQGLSPEKANPAAGLSSVQGSASSPSPVSSESSTGGPSPYLAPSPYTTPRSPGGGLKIR